LVAASFAQSAASLAPLAEEAFTLQPVPAYERKGLLRDEAALLVDRLLVRVAHGRGAIDVALGEGLAAFSVGDRLLRLGFSCLGDYSRERLGLPRSTAEKLARLAKALGERPLLREAVRSGAVTARKAESVLPVARGEDEAAWTERAKVETVRALRASVKAAGTTDDDEDEEWERVEVTVDDATRAKLDDAMALAGRLLGANAPKWQRLEAICEEFLGAHPAPELDGEGAAGRRAASCLLDRVPTGGALDEAMAWLEEEYGRWSFLEWLPTVPAPMDELAVGPLVELRRLDSDLRRLVSLRARWDETFGHLALLLRQNGLWRDLQFATFGHYCSERLGLSERAVSQRISLERRLWEHPALREAMRDGRLGYEKTRLLASSAACAGATDEEVGGLIERASTLPCAELERELERAEETQKCAQGEVAFRVPCRVGALLDEAFRAAREAAGHWLNPSQALELLAEHFLATWKPLLAEKNTLQKRVIARDGGRCQAPGCSRAALHVHHVVYRSHGGNDEHGNLVSLCAAHHLHAVHLGWLRVRGTAPDRLRWAFADGGGPIVARA
jgi:hypothetical protein